MAEDIAALVDHTNSHIKVEVLSPYTDLFDLPQTPCLYVFESDTVSKIFEKEVKAPTLSLFEWSRICISGYGERGFLPYPEYSAILYFLDTKSGYNVASKLDIGIPRRIFTYESYTYIPKKAQGSGPNISNLKDRDAFINYAKSSRNPILAISSSWHLDSVLYPNNIVFASSPGKINKATHSVIDSLWILGIYPYKTIVFMGTLELAGIPYAYRYKPWLFSSLLSKAASIATYNPEYSYELSYSRFDAILEFLNSKDKLNIQRETLYSFRYPLPPSLSRLLWYWSNMSKPVFPLLIFCMMAAFRRNIILANPRNNYYSRKTPIHGVIAMINGAIYATEGQLQKYEVIERFCRDNDLDYRSLYPVLYATYLACLNNNLPVGQFDADRFITLLRNLLESLNWKSMLTTSVEIYFPCTAPLQERCYPLVPYSYYV